MDTLFLHVGDGKTGSSYLQSFFGTNADALLNRGIHYPSHGDSRSELAGNATSGNGSQLLEILSGKLPSKTQHGNVVNSLLFSREQLAIETVRYKKELLEFCQDCKLKKISFLYFVRDPIDHASTSWAQKVKFNGMKDEPDVFYENFNGPIKAENFIKAFSDIPSVEINLLNYSRVSGDILKYAAEWLNLGNCDLTLPPKVTVNRSLDQSELQLQLQMNKFVHKRSAFIAYHLCNSLPEISGEHIYPSAQTQQEMLNRLSTSMDFVDDRLPNGHQYSRNTKPETNRDKIGFSHDQIVMIAKSINWEMERLRDELSK